MHTRHGPGHRHPLESRGCQDTRGTPLKATTAITRADRIALLVLGLLGAVSLVYQVTWTRQLTTLLGSTVTSIALVTAMFMVGMAAGAWLVGRRADRGTGHLRLLAGLSIGLGVSGAVAVPLNALVVGFYGSGTLGTSQGALLALAAALAAMMTLVPTAFVGAAFPVASRMLSIHRRDIASGAGSGYVAGTVGSVAGALLGGLVLVPAVGVNAAILLSAAVAAVAGVALYLASPNAETPPAASATAVRPAGDEAGAPSHPTRRPAMIAFALSGAAVMIYETVWTRELLLIFGASVYAVATMLAAALTGLAIGQWLGHRNSQDREAALATIGLLQLGGAGSAMLSPLLTRMVPLLYHTARGVVPGGVAGFIATQYALTFVIVALPCVLLGATAPIAIRLATSRRSVLGRDLGDAYALNTAGAVVGSLAGGLLLVPALSTVGTTAVSAALNITASVIALRAALPLAGATAVRGRLVASMALVAFGGAALLTAQDTSMHLVLAVQPSTSSISASHLTEVSKMMNVVYSKDPPQGRVTVFESPDGTRSLHVSGMNEGALLLSDIQTMETIIHLPSVIVEDASDVLVVGLGTGMTSDLALTRWGEPRVDTVEINPAVVEASHYFVDQPIEDHPRSRIIIDDARHYYATTDARYDIIASEPSHPLSTYSARMFTLESFRAGSRILKPGGVMLQWLPAYLMEDEDLELMVKTFGSAFPNTHVFATLNPEQPTQHLDYLMVGMNGDEVLDPIVVLAALEADDSHDFLVTHLMGPDEVRRIVESPDVPLNTDDRPFFEYRMPLRYLQWIWE
jgi:spermidine synthase